MKIIVEKYGGTSVESIERINSVARRVIETKKQGYSVVVVVSAMGKTTDDLIGMARQITGSPGSREMGLLVSTGEMVSSALLAMAIQNLGQDSIAMTGTQCGIVTSSVFDNARIEKIDVRYIKEQLKDGKIVVVAGYQGKNGQNITLLGRGGSDASAVAIAAALKADECRILSDVPGIYTADPRKVKNASLLNGISYEEMIEMAASGAQIMMGRSVEIARNYDLDIVVGPGFDRQKGTVITKEVNLEKVIITAVSSDENVALVNLYDLKFVTRDTSFILNEIAERGINIIILLTNRVSGNKTNLTFAVKPEHVEEIESILEKFRRNKRIGDYTVDLDVAQVSVIGSGIAGTHGVVADLYTELAKNKVDVLMASTSEIKISLIVKKCYAISAVCILHDRFQLSELNRRLKGTRK
ncbi:MAG: aspartate kinase [bacterium]|nr:aspartate kinase [bacterium]